MGRALKISSAAILRSSSLKLDEAIHIFIISKCIQTAGYLYFNAVLCGQQLNMHFGIFLKSENKIIN